MSAQLRQGTLSFHSSGTPQVNRPGPCPKAPIALLSELVFEARRRRLVGGINEQEVTESFREACALQAAELLDSDDDDSFSDNQPQGKLRRNGYSREKKL